MLLIIKEFNVHTVGSYDPAPLQQVAMHYQNRDDRFVFIWLQEMIPIFTGSKVKISIFVMKIAWINN